jgi:hypothetical protein
MWLLDGRVINEVPEKFPEGSALYSEEVRLPFTLTYYSLYLSISRLSPTKLACGKCKNVLSNHYDSRKLYTWHCRHSLG